LVVLRWCSFTFGSRLAALPAATAITPKGWQR
jgi:hypothetical protein